jgi:hypothetical protein
VGFFDDLDKKAPLPGAGAAPAPAPAETDAALRAAVDKLATGWVWDGVLGEPVPEDRRADAVEQRVHIEHKGGRFFAKQSVIYGRRVGMGKPDHHTERWLDREGLVQMLRDQPLVGQRLVAAAGKGRLER